MPFRLLRPLLVAGLFSILPGMLPAAIAGVAAPIHLTCNGLSDPLGTDEAPPQLSWQLQDTRTGARQTAYQILVSSTATKAAASIADIWDSARRPSEQSVNVLYQGPALAGQTRFFWRVRAWDQNGVAYPVSEVHWWETGLTHPQDWHAAWIGAETDEHKEVRESGAEWIWGPSPGPVPAGFYGFRHTLSLPEGTRSVLLFVTGIDSPSAWINGREALKEAPLPAWGHTPWGTYQRLDLTQQTHPGENTLAIGVHVLNSPKAAMSAVLLWQTADGQYHRFRTGDDGWRTASSPKPDWTSPDFHDSAWPSPVTIAPAGGNAFGRPWPADSVNLLRRAFTVARPVQSVRLYATALGAYKLRLNGQPIGDQVLAPGWTDYRQRVTYQTFDLTSQLRQGSNVLGATLAPGWYTTPLQWLRQPYNYGNTPPALRAQLQIVYKDGSTATIATDQTWQTHLSPVLKAEIYDGEDYDARAELAGWDQPSANTASWKPVNVIHPLEPKIVPQSFQAIRDEKTLDAAAITTPAPGVTIYDFGQNLAGVAHLRAHGAAGTHVQLRFGEVLNPDGTLYTENLRSAKATDHYTFKGSGLENFEPEFTFHGFRYVEVTTTGPALTGKLDRSSLVAVVFHTAAPFTAQLETGSPMINKLWSNILWGQRSNFIGVPTDCPQRDERLGWTADAQVFWRTASYNMNLDTFSQKYATDLRGTTGSSGMFGIYAPGTLTSTNSISPGWSDAGIIIPWTGWLQYGDTRILEQNWTDMARYLQVIEAANPDHLWRNQSGIGFGDWLAPGNKTANMLAATAYWAYDAQLMMQMAHALNKPTEEQQYKTMFEAIRSAFEARYLKRDGTITGGSIVQPKRAEAVEHATATEADDGKTGPGTQTGYALALYMHLVPDELRSASAAKLVDLIHANSDMLGTGFLGTPYVLSVLADTGHADLAYKLLLNTRYPSWGYQVDHGATTMWERWNGDKMMGDPGMNSFNHYAYGAVAAWIYQYAAGIDAISADPGFHRIHLHPNFSRDLGRLDFSYQTAYGTVHSAWLADGAGPVRWQVTLPPNTTGLLSLNPAEARRYTLDGKPLLSAAAAPAEARHDFTIPAGNHTLTIALP